LWYLAYEFAAVAGMDDEWTKKQAGQEVEGWLKELKTKGGFGVYKEILDSAKRDFDSERVTVETIKEFHKTSTSHKGGYILDPHSAIGVAAALRPIKRTSLTETYHIALATARPARFANAVDLALKDEKDFSFDTVLPEEFVDLEKKERKVRVVSKGAGWEGIREIIEEEVREELKVLGHNSAASDSLR
jgi:threonine synthase